MALFVTADPHFGHRNIIHHCTRPYKNKHQMERDIVKSITALCPLKMKYGSWVISYGMAQRELHTTERFWTS